MTHLLSTSVTFMILLSSLPNKAWRRYHWINYFPIIVKCTSVHPIQVHIQIAIPLYSSIDYSHESIGSALARFERSTFLDHAGTRTVVLRFLKIITPVKCVIPSYDDHLCFPKEGELYQRRRIALKVYKPWSVNIDKSNATWLRALRLLWDI
jgi:hypothetical protein